MKTSPSTARDWRYKSPPTRKKEPEENMKSEGGGGNMTGTHTCVRADPHARAANK